MNINNVVVNMSQIKEKILQQKNSGLKASYTINDIVAEGNLIAFNMDVYSLYTQDSHVRMAIFFHLRSQKIYRAVVVSQKI